jgi:Tfp pilus assembly protein PilN
VIEVNLIPGGKKRSSKKRRSGSGFSFSLPSLEGPLKDRWVLSGVISGVVAVVAIAWIFFSLSGQMEEVEVALAQEVEDSIRFSALIAQVEGLVARRDSITTRVEIIQTIDRERYVWPHVLDEVARALPDYTWLTGVVQVAPPPNLQLSITGQAGNNFAVAEFMDRLSQSPFIRVAELITSSQAVSTQGSGAQQLVYDFTLDVFFQDPPPEVLETVPLFDEGLVPSGAN